MLLYQVFMLILNLLEFFKNSQFEALEGVFKVRVRASLTLTGETLSKLLHPMGFQDSLIDILK